MLRCIALIIFAVLLTAQTPIPRPLPSQQPPRQSESGSLASQNRQAEKAPTSEIIVPPEIVDAIRRAIEAGANKAKSTANSPQPDNSAWLFSFLLVIFTGGLVVVGAFQAIFLKTSVDATKKTAEAALLQAKASIAAETSEFLIQRIDLVPYPDAPPGQADQVINPGLLPQNNFRTTITLANLGRTRSRMSELCIEWCVIDRVSRDKNCDPPIAPEYVHKIGLGQIFDKDQVAALKWSGEENSVIQLSDLQRLAINSDAAWLWVYGRIKYSDFLKEEYEMGFAAHWEAVAGATIGTTTIPTARGFVMEGPPPYVFRRKSKNTN